MSENVVVEVPPPIQATVEVPQPINAVVTVNHGGSSDPAEIDRVVREYLDANLGGIVSDELKDILSSGGSIFIDNGPPPNFIEGSQVGDVYIDADTGLIYLLEEG